MAIKIECQLCGFKNDLGRVFCTQCGKRLELTNTSLDDLARRRTLDWGPMVRRIVGWALALVVAGILGAAFWPAKPARVPMDPAGVKQIPMKVRTVQTALRARQPIAVPFTEAEVNGFLEARAKARKLDRLSVRFKPGSLTFSAGHQWRPVPQVTVLTNLVVPVSCELSGRFDGAQLVIRGGRLGHVPLPSPLASLMTPWFKGWFDDVLAQTGMVRALKSVTLDEGRAQLIFGP
jgi:hypothetical protein